MEIREYQVKIKGMTPLLLRADDVEKLRSETDYEMFCAAKIHAVMIEGSKECKKVQKQVEGESQNA